MRQIASVRRFCTNMNYQLLAEYSNSGTDGQEHRNCQALNNMLEEMRLGDFRYCFGRDYAFYQHLITETCELGGAGRVHPRRMFNRCTKSVPGHVLGNLAT